MSRPRLLIVGIDGATWKLVRPWIDDGSLPTLADLVQRGCSGELLSVPNMHSPAAWTSFMTGTNPGKHGIFFFSERVPGTYRRRPINGGHRDGSTIWRLLSAAGFRVGVLNVPMSYPAENLGDGYMIAGMDAPHATSPGFAYPDALAAEIERHVGRGVLQTGLLSGAIGTDVIRGRYAAAGRKLVERVRQRADVCEYLLATRPADVFAAVFTETDGAQHFFWRFLDPAHPDFHPEEAARYGGVVREVYQAIDQAVARLMVRQRPDAVLVLSDHGFGPTFGPQGSARFMQVLLEALGYAVPEREGLTAEAPPRGLRRRLLHHFFGAAPWIVPQRLRTLLRRRVPGMTRAVRQQAAYRLDWPRTRAYSAGSPGEIFLNLRGRDPAGVVDPGAYEEVRAEIAAALQRCLDGAGDPIVAEISRRETLYHGPYVDRAGDLYVRLADRAITRLSIDGKPIAVPRRLLGRRLVRSGFHRPEGVFIMAGAGVQHREGMTGLHLYDIAPTILYYLEQPVPTLMDGRVLLEAFAPALTDSRAVAFLDGGPPVQERQREPAAEYSPEEAGAVEERLRDLGYL